MVGGALDPCGRTAIAMRCPAPPSARPAHARSNTLSDEEAARRRRTFGTDHPTRGDREESRLSASRAHLHALMIAHIERDLDATHHRGFTRRLHADRRPPGPRSADLQPTGAHAVRPRAPREWFAGARACSGAPACRAHLHAWMRAYLSKRFAIILKQTELDHLFVLRALERSNLLGLDRRQGFGNGHARFYHGPEPITCRASVARRTRSCGRARARCCRASGRRGPRRGTRSGCSGSCARRPACRPARSRRSAPVDR